MSTIFEAMAAYDKGELPIARLEQILREAAEQINAMNAPFHWPESLIRPNAPPTQATKSHT